MTLLLSIVPPSLDPKGEQYADNNRDAFCKNAGPRNFVKFRHNAIIDG